MLFVAAGQVAQVEEPALAENVPAAHVEQDDAPANEKDPGAQIVHPAASFVPGLVTEPLKPGAHTVHSNTEALPPSDVEVPFGHETQFGAVPNVPGLQPLRTTTS